MTSQVMISTMDTMALLECLESKGLTGEEIKKTTGIEPSRIDSTDFEVPLGGVVKLWKMAAEVTGDPAIGIHLRKDYGKQYIHFVNYIGINSRNFLEALENCCKYGSLFSEVFVYELRQVNDDFVFSFNISSPQHQNGWIPEYHLSLPIYLAFMHNFYGPFPKEIRFRHKCPTDVQVYVDFFRAPVFFQQEENALVLDKKIVRMGLPDPNPHLQTILKKQAEAALSNLSKTDSFSRNVEEFIAQNISTGCLDIEMAAGALKMHRTTLHRKLKENGTSFNRLLTEIRQNLARFYLKQGMSIDQTAYLLGYANRSGFQYAFKCWFDQTPGDFRQHA